MAGGSGRKRKFGYSNRSYKKRRVGAKLTSSSYAISRSMPKDKLVTTRCFRQSNLNFTVASFAGAKAFKLNDLPNFAEFQALFDTYRIWKVEVMFIPKYSMSDYSSGGTAYGLPTIYAAADRNDSTVPATINELCEYDNVIMRRFDKTLKVTVYPRISQATAGNTGQLVDVRQKDLFVRAAYPDQEFNGIKYAVDMPVGLGDFKADIVYKYYLEFRDVK